jgi:hypothetical protein
MILSVNIYYFLNQLICVLMQCGVLFEVSTEILNIIQTSFGFKGIKYATYLNIRNCWKCGFKIVSVLTI